MFTSFSIKNKFEAFNRGNGPVNHIQAPLLRRQVCPRPGFYPVFHHQARPGQVRFLVCPNQSSSCLS